MRRPLGIAVVVLVGGIGLIAALDAFRGSSEPSASQEITTETSEPTPSTTEPRTPDWPGQLRRTVRLGRSAGASWESFWAVGPGIYTLRARFNVPRNAAVDIWFESVTGSDTIDLLGRGRPRNCVIKSGRDVCRAGLDFVLGSAETLRLLARKTSEGPMVIRLSITF
jgi:hypothetical protein